MIETKNVLILHDGFFFLIIENKKTRSNNWSIGQIKLFNSTKLV